MQKLVDGTVVDAGHYSYLSGPTKLDVFLWEKGVKLYVSGKKRGLKNIGIILLVDDMAGVAERIKKFSGTAEKFRKSMNIEKLPREYVQILKKYNVDSVEVQIVSQYRMKEKGRKLLKKKKLGSDYPVCELIVGTTVWRNEGRGYKKCIGFYDEDKTDGGRALAFGASFSRMFLGTHIEYFYRVFSSKKKYKDYYFEPIEKKI